MPYGTYVSYEDIKTIDLQSSNDKENDIIALMTIQASRDFELLARDRLFYPQQITRYYDHPEPDNCLRIPDDLLEIITFTTQNTNTTVSSGDYFLMTGSLYGQPPYDRIVTKLDGNRPNLLYTGTPQQANAITAYWGYCPRWADQWPDTGDTVVSLSGTTLTVNDVDGSTPLAIKPRIKAQQLLKVTVGSDTEYLYVVSKDTNNQTATVVRAVNGTSQVTPVGGETVFYFEPIQEVTRAVRTLSTWYYHRRNNNRPDLDRPILTDGGIILPPEYPKDVVMTARSLGWGGLR